MEKPAWCLQVYQKDPGCHFPPVPLRGRRELRKVTGREGPSRCTEHPSHSSQVPDGIDCNLYPVAIALSTETMVPGLDWNMRSRGSIFSWRLDQPSSLTPAYLQTCNLPLATQPDTLLRQHWKHHISTGWNAIVTLVDKQKMRSFTEVLRRACKPHIKKSNPPFQADGPALCKAIYSPSQKTYRAGVFSNVHVNISAFQMKKKRLGKVNHCIIIISVTMIY